MAAGEPRDLEGLQQLRRESVARAPVRLRESAMTLSAWRMETASAQGAGSMVLVDLPSGEQVCRGDGVHLGWSQQRLTSLFRTLSEGADEEPPFEVPQLG